MRRWWWPLGAGALLVAVAVGALWWWSGGREDGGREVILPQLSTEAKAGQAAFDRHCAECHGAHGRGSPQGPPLVHATYHPGHHADVAFELAVRRGVRAHHWRFGDMPAQPHIPPAEVVGITRYIRELQKANGIG